MIGQEEQAVRAIDDRRSSDAACGQPPEETSFGTVQVDQVETLAPHKADQLAQRRKIARKVDRTPHRHWYYRNTGSREIAYELVIAKGLVTAERAGNDDLKTMSI
jgi:hypothetical protein